MKHPITNISRISAAVTVALGTFINTAQAAVYGGGGIKKGAKQAKNIVGDQDLRERIVKIIEVVLSFMGLAAVVVIVIAGILMVFSGGDEEVKDRSKRIIFFTIIGLIIILLAQALVQFMADLA